MSENNKIKKVMFAFGTRPEAIKMPPLNWKSLFLSMNYFFKLIFIKKKYDVVFVSSANFNRGENGENFLFNPMIEFCKNNNLSFVVFEETYFKSYSKYKINDNAVPFDFILIMQIILRKLFYLKYKKSSSIDDVYFRELKISKILRSLFFKKFHSQVYITLIWSNVTLWRHINPNACIVDYQHGVICNGHEGYIKDHHPPKVKSSNNILTLVYGNPFKKILIQNDKSGFYCEDNVITVGVNKNINTKKRIDLNTKKILFTLQITPDFTKEVNEAYVKIIENLIENNADFLTKNNYEIIFKHHPRFNTYNCPNINTKYDFISFDNETSISDLLKSVSLHMTFYSTSAFDAATMAIPTIFVDMLEPFSPNDIFLKQYKYPCKDLTIKDYKDFRNILVSMDKKEIFSQCCDDVYLWSKEFYHDFNEVAFEDFLSNQIGAQKNVQSNLIKNDK